MKKSKFLKKSLAMLLAVMLVVAMIPLSASAAGALPELNKLYVDGYAVNVSGTTFAADVKHDAPQVNLKVETGSLGTNEGNATLSVVKADTSAKETVDENGKDISLSQWATATENGYTLTLELLAADKATSKTFTVELTKVSYGTTASLESEATPGVGTYKVAVNNADHKIDLTVPKGYAAAGKPGATFTVKTQDNATLAKGNCSSVTQDPNYSNQYTINVKADKQTFTVTSESGKNTVTWTVNVTEVDGLTSFALGDYEGTISGSTVTVEIPKSELYDDFGDFTDIVLPVNYETYHIQTTVQIAGKQYTNGDNLTIPALKSYNVNVWTNKQIVLSCANISNVQTYTLNVVVKESANTAITYAQFDNEIATVDGESISAVLPVKKADGKATSLDKVQVILYTDASENIKSISGFVKANTNYQTVSGKTIWYAGANGVQKGTLDLSKSRIITVTAEDGTTQTYTLSASLAEDKEEAYLQSVSLKSPDGYVADGSIKNNTITFTVPYMTLNVSDWKVYATPNTSANVVSGNSAVINGTTTASTLGLSTLVTTDNTNKGSIRAVNKNDNSVFQDYTIYVNLQKPAKMGKTLTDLEISIQNNDPTDDTNEKVSSRVTAYNSIKADDQSITITDKGLSTGNTGTITLKPANSLSGAKDQWGNDLYNILTKIETANGGVAFLAHKVGSSYVNAVRLNDLSDDRVDFNGAVMDYSWNLIVLPEDTARTILARGDIGSGYGTTIYENADESATGTVYSFDKKPQDALTYATISNVSVKDHALSINESTDIITADLPWSVTAETATETDKGTFIDFDLTPHARVQANGTYWLRDGGDTDDDGEANSISENNISLLFKRNDNHTVDVYINSNNSAPSYVALPNNQITVVAEDGSSVKTYTFKLTWADPNTEATIDSFKIGNSTGSISGKNITVTVPYGTDLKGLVPTFTTSSGATVTLGGESVVSGKTFVNFSHPVELLVISEDGKKTNPYTVTVKTAEAFSDVKPGDWFYDDVMAAASAGIVKGQGDGIFAPKASVTRRDFAIMLCRVLGVDVEGTAVSPFVDVNEDDYGIVAIAYCAAHGIVNGYENGEFQPNKTITRQEAAKMISAAMGVSKVSDELYTDDAKIADWASDYVYMAKAAGLMKGDTDGSFRPNDQITRAEAATIMMNAYNQ